MKNSFTLIELIVVIAIIAVLAAIIAPNAFRAIEKAQAQKAITDMKVIGQAALQHYADTGKFPPDSDTWPSGYTQGVGFIINDDGTGNPVPGWDGTYIERWPVSPWGRDIAVNTTYQWDYYDVDGNGTLDWNVEIGLGTDQEKRNRIGGLIDRTLENSDGICTGHFRNEVIVCPNTNWETWPSFIISN